MITALDARKVDGAITKYIYDGDQVICETTGSIAHMPEVCVRKIN